MSIKINFSLSETEKLILANQAAIITALSIMTANKTLGDHLELLARNTQLVLEQENNRGRRK